MTAKMGPARLRREQRRQQGQNRVLKILKGIVPALILLGTLILIPNPGTLVGLDDLAATILAALAAFLYWRMWRSGKVQSGEVQTQSLPQPTQKGDGWLVNLVALIWGSHKVFEAMSPGWRRLIKGLLLVLVLTLLITLIVAGMWIYGRFNPAPTSLAPSPIPSPFWPSGQTLPQSEIPIEGFGDAPTEQSGIPLEGFGATSAAPAPSGELITLAYPGRVGLYDWIWQQLGYKLTDASDPKGSFVCVYLADVRATGIEAAWKKNPSQALEIPINKQTIDVCGGVR